MTLTILTRNGTIATLDNHADPRWMKSGTPVINMTIGGIIYSLINSNQSNYET